MIAALILALAVSAEPPCPACPPTPAPKVFKGDFKCKPGLVKAQCGKEIRCVPPAQAEEMKRVQNHAPPSIIAPPPSPKVTVATPPPTPVPPQKGPAPIPVKHTPWRVLALAEAGSSFCGPQVRALGALRLRHDPTGLGLEVEHMGIYGGGGRLMWYPVQAEHLRLHLNAGFHFDQPKPPTQAAVKRNWDWAAGLGTEVPIGKEDRWGAVADLRWLRPVGTPDKFSADEVTKESCHQMLLMGGLYYRF